MFGKRQETVPSTSTEEHERLEEELAKLRGEVKALRSERDDRESALGLKEQIEKLKIEKDRLNEDNARKLREVEHKVGLERKRQETEAELIKRETAVQVREENLQADRERFETQMTFMQNRFETEVTYLKDMMQEISKRIPTVTWDISSNGHRESESADA